ncbi:MAG: hypothetical protein PVI26_13970, partial [Chitinispirillia bacterium]
MILLFSITRLGFPEQPMNIFSPLPQSTVQSGELFVYVSVKDTSHFYFDTQNVTILLDGKKLEGIYQISKKNISLLFLEPLSNGLHTITIQLLAQSHTKGDTFQWTFFCIDSTESNIMDSSATQNDTGKFAYKGYMRTYSDIDYNSNYDQTATNSWENSSAITLDCNAGFKYAQFPISVTLSNLKSQNNSSIYQYNLGLESKYVTLYYGENSLPHNKLVVNSICFGGLYAAFQSTYFDISYIHGSLGEEVEGRVHSYNPDSGFIPSTPIDDSTYYLPGSYKRDIIVTQLCFHGKRYFQLSVSGLRATDDISSIKYGTSPKQNAVLGGDIQLNVLRSLLSVKSGIALSITTDNISNGALSESKADSSNLHLPLNPEDFEHLFIINESTYPLNIKEFSSYAWYLSGGFSLRNHTFQSEYTSIGNAYNSFGNPFLSNNRKGFSFEYSSLFLNELLSASTRFERYTSIENDSYTNEINYLFSTYLNVNPNTPWPQISTDISVMKQNNEGGLLLNPPLKHSLFSFYIHGSQKLPFQTIQQSIHCSYSQFLRTFQSIIEQKHRTYCFSLRYEQHFPFDIKVSEFFNLQTVHSEELV